MRVSHPIPIALPADGVPFAEGAHAGEFRMAERVDPYHKLIFVLDGCLAYRETGRVSPVSVEAGSVLFVPVGVCGIHHRASIGACRAFAQGR